VPWREYARMDERLRFVARLLEGKKMAPLCREFDLFRKPATNSSSVTRTAALKACLTRPARSPAPPAPPRIPAPGGPMRSGRRKPGWKKRGGRRTRPSWRRAAPPPRPGPRLRRAGPTPRRWAMRSLRRCLRCMGRGGGRGQEGLIGLWRHCSGGGERQLFGDVWHQAWITTGSTFRCLEWAHLADCGLAVLGYALARTHHLTLCRWLKAEASTEPSPRASAPAATLIG
jgi:hypothetical protein